MCIRHVHREGLGDTQCRRGGVILVDVVSLRSHRAPPSVRIHYFHPNVRGTCHEEELDKLSSIERKYQMNRAWILQPSERAVLTEI